MSDSPPVAKPPRGLESIARTLVARGPWGSVWRGEHARHGAVLVVAYEGAEGRALLEEATPGLDRWAALAGRAAPGLAPLREINRDAATPHLVVDDPGGETLSFQFAAGPDENLVGAGRALAAVAKVVTMARTYDLCHTALAPNLVMRAPSDSDAPWHLVPVAPGARRGAARLVAPAYSAPELAGGAPLDDLNADVFALSWIALDLFRGQWPGGRDAAALRQELPYTRLRGILTNGLKPVPGHGGYDDPKMLQLAIERWIKEGAAEDLREHRDAVAAQTRTPVQQRLHDNAPMLKKAGIGLGIALALLMVVFCVPALFRSKNTTNTPYGTVNLFFGELVKGNAPGALAYAEGEATLQVQPILTDIRRMEEKSLASPFNSFAPQVSGAGDRRNAKVDLKGKNGDLFMIAEVTLAKGAEGQWKVTALYFKPLREEE